MKTTNPRKISFLILFLALLLLVGRLFYPFLTVILWSGLLYVFLEPIHKRLRGPNSIKGRKTMRSRLSALFLSIFGVIVILIPLAFLAFKTIQQLADLLKLSIHFVEENIDKLRIDPQNQIGSAIQSLLGDLYDVSTFDPLRELQSFLASGVNQLIKISTSLIMNISKFVVTICFMVFTLYYLLMDASSLGDTFVSMMPIAPQYTRLFMSKLRETGRQLVIGYFLVSLFQGFMMFILSIIFGFKNNLVLAVLTAISSFVPLLGTTVVWAPMGIYLAVNGQLVKAIVFVACASVIVATLDNFIRPIVLGEQIKIHPLLLFFSITGGLAVFGFNGLILGPVILILFVAAGDLYRALYEESELSDNKNEK
ncbi:MAG: AI-2E family transporter [Spirochaetota bacterium]|nr:AI-2E family transporter [Spirochaetota bacterium]